MEQIFISYAREDLSFVNSHLLEVCRNSGYEPWYDVEGIKAAETWERVIPQAILNSRWLLLVMSPDSARSEGVKDELQVAIGEAGIRVIPLLLKDCRALDFHIRIPRLQYIDFRKDTQAACRQLTRRLTGLEETPIRIEQNVTTELISVAASLLSRFELGHLRNLAQGRTDYTGRRSMRHEIRHLCDLGLLMRKENKRIGDMRDGERHNIAEFVALTPAGQAIAEKLPRYAGP